MKTCTPSKQKTSCSNQKQYTAIVFQCINNILPTPTQDWDWRIWNSLLSPGRKINYRWGLKRQTYWLGFETINPKGRNLLQDIISNNCSYLTGQPTYWPSDSLDFFLLESILISIILNFPLHQHRSRLGSLLWPHSNIVTFSTIIIKNPGALNWLQVRKMKLTLYFANIHININLNTYSLLTSWWCWWCS